jgi:hypothetical protein
MCGIFGVVSASKNGMYADEVEYCKQMFMTMTVRGEDGSGGYWASPDKDVQYLKRSGNPWWLFFDEGFKPFMAGAKDKARAFVGHSRYSTKGENTDENTHPFQKDHITMVHNGTIHHGLHYPKDVVVDSHALTIQLADKGLDVFNDVTGAYACVWYDRDKNTINFIKNHERPLCMIKALGSYYFASEMPHLLWIFGRTTSSRQYEVVTLTNHTHYSIKLDDPKLELVEVELDRPKYTGTTVTTVGKKGAALKPVKPEKTEVAFFKVESSTTEKRGNIVLHTYECLTEEGEICFFRSPNHYKRDVLYLGNLIGTEYNKFGFGPNVPCYKIQPSSVMEVDEGVKLQGGLILTDKELDEAGEKGCFSCSADIDPITWEDCEPIEVTRNKYRLICKRCTKLYKNAIRAGELH